MDITRQLGKASFLRWWLIVWLQALAFGIAVFFNFHIELWENDLTMLGFTTIGLWAASTAAIGVWHIQFFQNQIDHLVKIGWFLAETCLALGMIGTVAGFLIMLESTFEGINVDDTSTIQTALTNMALGMSTALYTTLVGLITSQFIKIQLVNLEHVMDKHEKQ